MNWEKLREYVKNTDKETLRKVVIGVDGHSIYDPKQFLEKGLNAEVVKAFTKKLHSGKEAKERIYVKGEVAESITGVYGLDLLEFIAGCFDVKSWKMGRGSRASHLAEQLVDKFNQSCT